MLLIGLMLIRNENDILREVLAEHVKFADHIFVLDGTTDDPKLSEEICRSFKNVSHFTEDQLPANYPRPIKCGCRQFMVDRAREKFGTEGWFAVLHGDEIFVDSPRDIIKRYDRFFDCLVLDNLLFFVHKEQSPFKFDPGRPISEQIYWYAGPGWPEGRLFKNKPDINYDVFRHYQATPRSIKFAYKTTFKIKHYPFRDPAQQKSRAQDRVEVTKFSPGSYADAFKGRYYMDETFFKSKFYRWISKEPPRPRLHDPLLKRFYEDVNDAFFRVSSTARR